MTDRLPGSFKLGKYAKSKTLTNILFIALAALIVWSLYNHFHKPAHTAIKAGSDLTTSQLETAKTNSAQKNVSNKNYALAIQNYLGAASNAYANKDYQKSESLLKECIQQIPDQYVPWYIYNSLAKSAKALNDSALEKSSLQTAIKKASEANTGADQGNIQAMQTELQGIK